MRNRDKKRIVILMNDLPPYRVPIYQDLAQEFDVMVLLGGREDNRNWNRETVDAGFCVKTSWGFTFKRTVGNGNGGVSDLRYTHVTVGFLLDLIHFRPDVVISAEMGFRSLLGMVYGLFARIPVWIWWGGTLHTERERSLAKRFIRKWAFAPLSRHWISYGQSSTSYLKSIGVDRCRILQVQNSADHRSYVDNVNEEEPILLDGPLPRILFVGQLIGRKGISELLTALSSLQNRGLTFSTILVGDGPEASSVDLRINEEGIRNVVRLPYVPPERLASVYKACDFMVFPTLEDVWGLVVNEALMCEVPSLVSKYAGCAEELVDERYIFDPLNKDDFESILERAIIEGIDLPSRGRLWPTGGVAKAIATAISAG